MRYGSTENKAACLNTCYLVDLGSRPRLHQLVNRAAKSARISEQGRDVAEHDTRLGIIGDRPDGSPKIILEGHGGHPRFSQVWIYVLAGAFTLTNHAATCNRRLAP